ncbi:CRISPR-associated protein Cas2 [Massilia sp. 9I]|uniref:CRISPR-associated protein Cas2 n=1 Tax=Massilia sp. 9I TaxID=2653152 RepID=UPI0012F2EA9F|nr:CRISPR-associated protein Cas2 [Massilia sp. 9I]VXC04661.1 CRISPR-associated endoribonuclease Cas2 [Massilia sp. 9I]
MTTYTVSYDLNREKDYALLLDELRRLDGVRTQASFWLVAVNNTAKELHDHLKGFVDSDDALWVSEVTSNKHYSNAKKGTNNFLATYPPQR